MTPFTPKTERMAVLVARGTTVIAAGAEVGLSRSSAYRRGRDPDFRALVAELRGRMLDEAVGLGADALAKGMGRFIALLDSKDEQVSLRAGKLVVDAFIGLSNHADLTARIEALENAQREQSEGSTGAA